MTETIWVAIITAISTTVPNIVITIIKNQQELKLKKFETLELAKRQSVINYLEALGDCFTNDGSIALELAKKYQKAVHNLLFYFPDLDLKLITEARNSINTCKSDQKINEIMPLIKQLSKSLEDK